MKNSSKYITQKTIVAMNIFDYVQASGLTQTEIAKRAGISKSTLSAYIQGVNYPRPEQMAALARVFGVSVGSLTSSSDEKAEAMDLSCHPEIEEVVKIMLTLPVADRHAMLVVARAFENDYMVRRYGIPDDDDNICPDDQTD